jgi:hypothetical protein
MSSSSCGLVTAVFFVCKPFGDCKKKQCAGDTRKIVALHEGFQASPLCSNNNTIKAKMGVEHWWNYTEKVKPKCSEKNPYQVSRGLTKDQTVAFTVRSRRPTA